MRKLLMTALLLSGCGDELTNTEYVSVPGPQGPVGDRGETGSSGLNGNDGVDGQDGTSCSIVSVSPGIEVPYGGALITCGPSSTLLLNGEPGPQGSPGPISPYALTEIINVCNDAAGIYDEVILRTQSGRLLASFSDNVNGYNTRLSELTQGNYQTTDGSNCLFSVDSNNTVTDMLGNVWTQ